MNNVKNILENFVIVMFVVFFLITCAFPFDSSSALSTKKEVPVPTIVTTSVTSTSSIKLAWKQAGDEANYSIFRATSADGQYARVALTGETTFTDTGLVQDNTYYYKISAAINNTGESVLSPVATVKIAAPNTPENVTALALSATSIGLSWNAVYGASSYKIYRATGDNGPWIIPIIITESTSYNDTGLIDGTEYFYNVIAVNILGESEPVIVSAITYIIPIPAAPENIRAVLLSATSINLSWDAVEDATSYKVYRAEGSSGPWTVPIATTEDTLLNDISVIANNDYFYKISAVNIKGETVSNVISVSTKAPPVPIGLKTGTATASSIIVTWNISQGAAAYRIYTAPSSDGVYTLLSEVNGNTYTHTGLSLGDTHYYKVSAVNIIGESAKTTAVVGTIAVPAAPPNVTLEALSESSIKITWDPVPGAVLYSVYRGTQSNSLQQTVTTTTTTFTDTRLNPYCQYYYGVIAVNEIGTGIQSQAVSTYTYPIPLVMEEWISFSDGGSFKHNYFYFPSNGSNYRIQWASPSHYGEADGSIWVSTYWNSTNSMQDLLTAGLGTPFFSGQTRGFENPRVISVPSTGYIIIDVYSSHLYGYGFSVRYLEE